MIRKVYGRGLNISGQIDGTYNNYEKFTQLMELSNKEVKDVGCGYLQSYYFLKSGHLLKRGNYMDTTSSMRTLNFYRMLPSTFHFLQVLKFFTHTARYLRMPLQSHHMKVLNYKELDGSVNFTRAIFNQSAVHLFDDQSNMYVIGENYFGQRVTNDIMTIQSSLRKIQQFQPINETSLKEHTFEEKKQDNQRRLGQKIVDAALGFQHTIIITERGEAYGCGKADSYQIQPYKYHFYKDLMTMTHIEKPQLIWGKKKVVKAACGNKHSILMTEDKKLYALGSNKFGQCGLEIAKHEQVKKLTEIYFPFLSGEEIIDIKCGSFHTLILTNRHLYFMGSTKRNQNPFSSFKENICSPTIMNLPAKPIKIFTNFQRNGVITEDGRAYLFGGTDLQYRGGEKSELEIIDGFSFNSESSIGLGFAHTIIVP